MASFPRFRFFPVAGSAPIALVAIAMAFAWLSAMPSALAQGGDRGRGGIDEHGCWTAPDESLSCLSAEERRCGTPGARCFSGQREVSVKNICPERILVDICLRTGREGKVVCDLNPLLPNEASHFRVRQRFSDRFYNAVWLGSRFVANDLICASKYNMRKRSMGIPEDEEYPPSER